MSPPPSTDQTLRAENAKLRARLEEAEETLRAIRAGEVDALVVEGDAGPQIFTLQGLDAEQNRFRGEMLAQVSDAVVGMDTEDRITFLNAAAERRYGVRADDVLGGELSAIFTRLWPSPAAEAAMRKAASERGEWRGELIHRTRDGRELHVEASIAALRGPGGEPMGMVSAIRDVTERKQLEQEKTESLRLLDTLLRHAPVGFAFFDRDLRFVRINERLAAINGHSVAAHLGRLVAEILPALAPALKEMAAHILATGQPVLDQEFTGETARASGVARFWNASWYPVRDEHGEIMGFGALVEDVTERKQLEQEKAEALRLLDTLLTRAPVGFLFLDRDLRFVRINERLAEMNGLPIAAHLGRTVAEILPTLEPTLREVTARILATGQPVLDHEFAGETARAPGVIRYWRESWYPVRDERGEIIGFGAVVEDITERKRAEGALLTEVTERQLAEAQVRQLNHELELRVATRTRELEQKAAELVLTSGYKSEFLATMSHELRTPLNSLLILSRALADNKTGNLTARQIEWAQTIHGSGTDLLKLIDEVLDFSKVAAGKATITPSVVTLTSVLKLNERTFRPVAEQRHLSFTLALEPGLPATLLTDAYRLQQILSNLLANAFKFTAQGGVTLSIGSSSGGWSQHQERLNRAPRVIAFAVRDTGIGLAPGKQGIIFEAFRQAETGTAREYGGTGLGLAISRDLAHLLGGAIGVESEPGAGSTFTLYLPDDAVPAPEPDERTRFVPAVASDPQAAPAKPDASAAILRNRKVLVVDDDARNVFALVSLLENHEVEVLTATGGRAAIDRITGTPGLDLVLMDMMMPDMDGYETIREVRKSAQFRTLPILALTAKAMKGDREKCLDAGASDYIAKPVKTDQLLSLIRVWLSR